MVIGPSVVERREKEIQYDKRTKGKEKEKVWVKGEIGYYY